jgi:transposase-like protein
MEVLMSKAKKLTTKYRLEQWTSIIQERIKSGKRVDEWCSENGISRDAYYYWLRKVKLTASEKTVPEPPQLPKVVQIIPPAPVCEVHNSGTAIILKVNGITLEIQDCASDSIIEKTLRALRNIC